jgi:hypothetical protein
VTVFPQQWGPRPAALLGLLSPLAACYHYRAQPIQPPTLEQQYRARTLSDPGLKQFIEAQPVEKPPAWPPTGLSLETLTLVAFYFHPDLDTARARLAASKAAVITASTKPNPGFSGAGGYTDAERAPYVLKFSLDWIIETAGSVSTARSRPGISPRRHGFHLGKPLGRCGPESGRPFSIICSRLADWNSWSAN